MTNENHDYIESDAGEYGDQTVSEMDLTDPDFDEMPQKIRSLIGSCEIGEKRFSNDDMSVALKFGELLWRRLTRMAEHYERMAAGVEPVHPMIPSREAGFLNQAAKDMWHVLEDCKKDL
jgi:hypothetical protein